MKLTTGWYVALSSPELKRDRPLAIERFGLPLVAWRDSTGSAIVMKDICPHRSVKLSLGQIKNNCIVCPFHGFEFRTNGSCNYIPETKKAAPNLNVETFIVTEKYGFIWIYLGNEKCPGDLPWFAELNSKHLIYSEYNDVWPIHFSRCIENQLDYAHLPFLHKNSIGKNFDVSIKRNFDLEDNGIVLIFEDSGGLKFRFPNIWMLTILANKFYQMLAFVPINSKSTKLYARTYQGFITLSVLKSVVGKIFNFQSKLILNQDKLAVLSQGPSSSLEATDEHLYPSDQGISWYRKKWLEKEIEV